MRAYYRDLHDRDWSAIVTHFYPAKVTARFAVPDTDARVERARGAGGRPAPRPHAREFCAPRVAIAIVGNWARLRARRCTGELDEAWFYVMSGTWKIIHLESGQTLAL